MHDNTAHTLHGRAGAIRNRTAIVFITKLNNRISFNESDETVFTVQHGNEILAHSRLYQCIHIRFNRHAHIISFSGDLHERNVLGCLKVKVIKTFNPPQQIPFGDGTDILALAI